MLAVRARRVYDPLFVIDDQETVRRSYLGVLRLGGECTFSTLGDHHGMPVDV